MKSDWFTTKEVLLNELREVLWGAIDLLPEKYRDAFVRIKINGEEATSVAKELRRTPACISERARVASWRLRRIIGHNYAREWMVFQCKKEIKQCARPVIREKKRTIPSDDIQPIKMRCDSIPFVKGQKVFGYEYDGGWMARSERLSGNFFPLFRADAFRIP